jgi:hypothetical protein
LTDNSFLNRLREQGTVLNGPTPAADDIGADFLSELRQAEASARARKMSRAEKERLLKSHGWVNHDNNIWTSCDGTEASFGTAAAIQILRDINKKRR